MDRKEFLKTCGIALVGLPFAASILTSCQSIYYASSNIVNNRIVVPLSEFEIIKKNSTAYIQKIFLYAYTKLERTNIAPP